MRTLVKTLKKQDAATLVGLTFVATVILPCIGFIVYNICIGNFNNF
jgi:hypothetical protein